MQLLFVLIAIERFIQDMAIYRNVQMSFWTDRKIAEEFSPDEKYLYLFLMTNPMTNLCGCYEIGKKQMSIMTGLDMKKVKSVLASLESKHKVIVYSEETSELLLINWYKYNWTASEKFRKPLLNEIKAIKNDEFRFYLEGLFNNDEYVLIPYQYGSDTTVTVTVTDTVPVTVSDTVTVPVNQTVDISYSENKDVNAAILDFLEYRKKEIKKPMGDIAVARFLNKLKSISSDPDEQIKAINTAIENGWQTVYPPKEKPPDKWQPSNQRSYDYDALERSLLAKG